MVDLKRWRFYKVSATVGNIPFTCLMAISTKKRKQDHLSERHTQPFDILIVTLWLNQIYICGYHPLSVPEISFLFSYYLDSSRVGII